MLEFFVPITFSLPKIGLKTVLDILIVAFIIYQLIMVVRGTRAAHVIGGIGVVLLLYMAAIWLELELVRSILANVVPYTAIALIVLFQSEIRRTLARIGRRRWLDFGGRLQRRESTDEVIWALGRLSEMKVGALIVIERDIGLRTFVESGQVLDANLSRDLLLSIFLHSSPLHDGAVIIQGDRVAAAACFLPLTMNPLIATKLGTRHRASLGITEESDCLSLVVSEETGHISVAAFGEIEMDVTMERVEERLANHFGYRPREVRPQVVTSGATSSIDVEALEHRKARGV